MQRPWSKTSGKVKEIWKKFVEDKKENNGYRQLFEINIRCTISYKAYVILIMTVFNTIVAFF